MAHDDRGRTGAGGDAAARRRALAHPALAVRRGGGAGAAAPRGRPVTYLGGHDAGP
ncbi:hypothetical protein OHA37_03595 [Streptomyces sp. NBC_00335]|uniref:hypothetical protein n=1 Tax=unclassified Streptomyces TaxID=2593676 RepID=UPI002251CC33|nr:MULTISPECIES: hypothetical protein [unclassified Streptomyces]MCX5402969.1 hypothetical protein [Streptomyces sp. NBC_00086]